MEKVNCAYIDGANLHSALKELGWELDYARFRVWLEEKYKIRNAYVFIGLIAKYSALYAYLQEAGFKLIFKEVVYDGKGKPKGNCDADLVLKAARDVYEGALDTAVLVSSDGDYASLVKFLRDRKQIKIILSPNLSKKYSILLKRTQAPIAYLNDQRSILETRKEKAPGADKPHKGPSRSDRNL